MSARQTFHLHEGHSFSACPNCGNARDFVAYSGRVAEDCCEVWVECGRCKHDPTREHTDYRLEDVWGSLDPQTIQAAMHCRDDALATLAPAPTSPDTRSSEVSA